MTAIDFSYPFDSVNSDRKTAAATERRFFNALFKTGVVSGFELQETAAGVYNIGEGIAIVSGAIAGITSVKSITAQPAQAAKMYIVLRLDTNTATRAINLLSVSALKSDSEAQLDAGGQFDLPLYSVEGLAGGTYTVVDMRANCTTFEAAQYKAIFDAFISNAQEDTADAINALTTAFDAATGAVETEVAGLFGAAGRQGFMNPQFSVNQRAQETYSLDIGTIYTFDRWLARIFGRATSSPINVSRVQDGAKQALSIQNKTFAAGIGAGASCIAQNIENGVRTFCAGAKKFTVSFDAKATTEQRLAVEPVQILAAGGAGVAIAAQVVNLTQNWTRFSLTFTGTQTPTAEQMKDILQIGFYFGWTGYAARFGSEQNASNTVYLANMQINEGESQLACYARPIHEELEACQRYFAAFGFTSFATGAQNNATRQVITGQLSLTRRLYRKPKITFTDRLGVDGVASAETVEGAWRNALACSPSESTQEFPAFVVTNKDAAALTRVAFGSIQIDAETVD